MSNFTFPYFGDLDINNLENYYDLDIDLDGIEIQIDIHFNEKSIDIEKASVIKNFISNVSVYSIQNKILIEQLYHNKTKRAVRKYIKYHLTDLNEAEFFKLSKIVDLDDKNTIPEIQLLKKIKLTRIGLFPHGKFEEKYFAEFDYIIDQQFIDTILVLQTDDDNNLHHVTMFG